MVSDRSKSKTRVSRPDIPACGQMSLPIGRAAVAVLLVASLIAACTSVETRAVTCRNHKVSNGELTECR